MIRKLTIALLGMIPGVAHAEWYRASTEHFIVYANDRADEVKQFAADLERFDKTVRFLRKMPDPPVGSANRVVVYMVSDVRDVQKLAHNDSVAGFYKSRAGEPIAIVPRDNGSDSDDLKARPILFHEYSHNLMLTTYPDGAYPRWFVEGFAEFFATVTFDPDGSAKFGAPPQYRADGIIRAPIPVSVVLDDSKRKLSQADVDSLYGRAWLLLHLLQFDENRRGQLGTYVQALNSGKAPLDAAQQAFGDLKQLERELNRHAGIVFEMYRIPADRLQLGPVELTKLSPGAAAIMPVRIRSKNGVDNESAPDVFAAARKIAATYPGDPFVQVTLAETACDARDYVECEAAADRAIAVDPKLVPALYYKAVSHFEIAVKAEDHSSETWSAIRRLIATANRVDPEDPRPLILYYQSFVEPGFPPSEAAKDGLFKAFTLAPNVADLRLATVAMLLNDHKAEDARSLLKPLAYSPHAGDLADLARDMITAIDSGGTDAALKVMQRPQKEGPGNAKGH